MTRPVLISLLVVVTMSVLAKAWTAVDPGKLEAERKKTISCTGVACLHWYFQYGHQLLGDTMRPTDEEANSLDASQFFHKRFRTNITNIKEAFELCVELNYTTKAKCESFFKDFSDYGYPISEIPGFCQRYNSMCSIIRESIVIPFYIEHRYFRREKMNFELCWFTVKTMNDLIIEDNAQLAIATQVNTQDNVCNCRHAHALGNLYRKLVGDSNDVTLTSFFQTHCIKGGEREYLAFDPDTIERLASEIYLYIDPENDPLKLASLILREERLLAYKFQGTQEKWSVKQFILLLKKTYPNSPEYYQVVIDIVNTAIHYQYTFNGFTAFSHATNYVCSENTESLRPDLKTDLIELRLRLRKVILNTVQREKKILKHYVEKGNSDFQKGCQQNIERNKDRSLLT